MRNEPDIHPLSRTQPHTTQHDTTSNNNGGLGGCGFCLARCAEAAGVLVDALGTACNARDTFPCALLAVQTQVTLAAAAAPRLTAGLVRLLATLLRRLRRNHRLFFTDAAPLVLRVWGAACVVAAAPTSALAVAGGVGDTTLGACP